MTPKPTVNLILLGPPGAGKGTQARLLQRRFGMVPLSSGELLRAAVVQGTPAGIEAQAVMDRGDLVSDRVVVRILGERLEKPDSAKGAIFDGFPRTVAQADALDTLLVASARTITGVIFLEGDDATMAERVVGRFVCAQCGEGYHSALRPTAQPGLCDVCGGQDFLRRSDDTKATVAQQLRSYNAQRKALAEYYVGRAPLMTVDAVQPIPELAEELTKIINEAT